MGIKHLWTVLAPYCEKKPLYELQGKTVAIDLSCWICEAQNISEYQIHPQMYLRNLYFRTCFLLLMDVNLVFVLEGKAPELKYDTIAARNALQFKGVKPKKQGTKTGKDRSRFHFILKRCEEMLELMGLTCIRGTGEAESMCAYLNSERLVDGCISQDSDCFAYGAQVVYRNFSISSQGPCASGGAIDIYDIKKPFESIDFGRNKIIVMALLCGSDYNDGVQGIGKESMLKFFEHISDEEVLDKIRSWRTQNDSYEKLEKQISDKNICTSCGHQGKLQSHAKTGCIVCKTTKSCNSSKEYKEERQNIKNELNIRSRALEDPNFPDENLIQEFLVKKDSVSKLELKWKHPNLIGFMNFTTKYLQWELIYSFEKFLPIITRWHCLNHEIIANSSFKGILQPTRIKKVRNPKGVPSFEIIWSDPCEYYKDVIPEQVIKETNIDLEKLWSTIEPQILVEKAYPKLVAEFKQSKIKPKVSKRKKKVCNKTENTSTSEPIVKKTRKNKGKNKGIDKMDNMPDLESSFQELNINKPCKKVLTLDNFFKKALLNSKKQIDEADNPKIDIYHSTPAKFKENTNKTFNFSGLENDELDLSDIIEGIIARRPGYIKEGLEQINLCDEISQLQSSSFFTTNPIENDLFEKTFNMKDESSDDNTEQYDFDENGLIDNIKNNYELKDINTSEVKEEDHCGTEKDHQTDEESSLEDSFCEKYIPLAERLKNRMN